MNKYMHSQLSTEDTEQPYRIFFETASDGMIINNVDSGCVVDANPSAVAMHGYTRDEFIGLHLTTYLHPDSQRLLMEPMEGNQPNIMDVPAVHLRKDGTSFHVDVRRTTIPFQSQPCLLSILHSISERTDAEHLLQAQAVAVMQERQRLAQNLHNTVSQSLFSVSLIADVLPRLWERDQNEARRSLDDLRRLARAAQAEMRALLGELQPSTLLDTDLGELLQLLGNAISGRINVPVAVSVAHGVILPSEIQVAFYSICQEALSNIAKHAKASLIDINLMHDGTSIELRIRDNGLGFDSESPLLTGHHGLSMMQERAESANAWLTITSEPGQGTELILHWMEVPKELA